MQSKTQALRLPRKRRVVPIALLVFLGTGVNPAPAQDLFGFVRLFLPPVTHAPVYQPQYYPELPTLKRAAPRRPKVVRVEQPPTKIPLTKPKVPGEVTNPVPELLADSTLRPGDIVMFPDGPRVFQGRSGTQHSLADFAPLSRAATPLPPSTRKLVANLRPGQNDAWRADKGLLGSKLTANIKDVETTSSLDRKRR
jgi:hypothetical protein